MTSVLFVLPRTHTARLPHFRCHFELLSEHFECHVLMPGDPSLDGERFGRTTLHIEPRRTDPTVWGAIKCAVGLTRRGVRVAKQNHVDCVVAYDPLLTGAVATVVKLLAGTRSVIEINGHLRDSKAAVLAGLRVSPLRRAAFNATGSLVLFFADAVKILNQELFDEWHAVLKRKACFIFHPFVPVHLFPPVQEDGDIIFCLGHPLKLKGADLLLAAFDQVRDEFPDVRLVIMGHAEEPELSEWRARVARVPRAELRKPVQYDEVADVLRTCRVFVLPSRSEAMGRVLIEAMASRRPVIGTRVGGIPSVIRDGVNGLLVEPDNVSDLADKLRTLLSDRELRSRMGAEGARLSQGLLGETSYVKAFVSMIERARMPRKQRGRGIVWSVFQDDSSR